MGRLIRVVSPEQVALGTGVAGRQGRKLVIESDTLSQPPRPVTDGTAGSEIRRSIDVTEAIHNLGQRSANKGEAKVDGHRPGTILFLYTL